MKVSNRICGEGTGSSGSQASGRKSWGVSPRSRTHGAHLQGHLAPPESQTRSQGAGALRRCFPACNVGLHPSPGPHGPDLTACHGTEGLAWSSGPPRYHDAADAELPVPLWSHVAPLRALVLSAPRGQADVTRIPTLAHGMIYLFYDTNRKLPVTVCYLRTPRLVHTRLGQERGLGTDRTQGRRRGRGDTASLRLPMASPDVWTLSIARPHGRPGDKNVREVVAGAEGRALPP